MVVPKRVQCRPSPRSSLAISGPEETARSSASWTIVTAKVALAAGSSQQGKARRALVLSNWVVAIVCSRPSASTNVLR